MPKKCFRALTIAGSDSGGGAGIQADIKVFSALGCHGASAITAVTAQNTCGIRAAGEVPPRLVALQIEAVLEDIGADAVKTGMLCDAATVKAVSAALLKFRQKRIVVDPVLSAKDGATLLEKSAIPALMKNLFPLAALITPNIPEAEFLSGVKISCRTDMEKAGGILLGRGPGAVLVKGGHAPGRACDDVLLLPGKTLWLCGPRIRTRNTHGTGCLLSAAITAYLARGMCVKRAVILAKRYLTAALQFGAERRIGGGAGPANISSKNFC
ncbi:MAG: bifunctional hydroxymethylpyrimidine kinase/phosphomethylpyrimidine kinase [Elusimicrobiales bacterium]